MRRPAWSPWQQERRHRRQLFAAEQLSAIVQNTDVAALRAHHAALMPEMKREGITTPERVAAFLNEVGHETEHLNIVEKFGDERYFRWFLGGEWFYHSRGSIMLTWTGNYSPAENAIGLDPVVTPELVEEPEVAAKPAVRFWTEHGLNSYAGRGDVRAVSSISTPGGPTAAT